jgi:hypothetical protein
MSDLWQVVWLQTLTGAREVFSEPMPHVDAVNESQRMTTLGFAGFGGVFFVEPAPAEDDKSGLAPALSATKEGSNDEA